MNRRSSAIMQGTLAGLLLMLAALLGGPALAADGRLLAAAGEVTVERPAAAGLRAIPADAGFELLAGDTIRTGAQGRAQIRLTDGAIFSLQPRTVFRIDDYRFDGEQQRGFFSLLRGALRTATGQIGKRDRDDYRLQTPTATVGIRGTQYMAQETVCDPGCSPGDRAGLHVSVTEGRIAVANDFGAIEIGAGEAARVAPGAAPRRAALAPRLPPRQLLAAEQDEPGADPAPVLIAQRPAAAPGHGADNGGHPGGSDTRDGDEDEDGQSNAAVPIRVATAGSPAGQSAGTSAPAKPATPGSAGSWDEFRLAQLSAPAASGQSPLVGNEPDPDSAGLTGSGRVFDIDFAPNAGRNESGELVALNEGAIVTPRDPSAGAGEPGAGEPGTGGPGAGEPGTGEPGTGEPGTGEPGTGEPGTGEPGTGEPGTGEPGAGEPGTGEPGTGEPGAGEPGTGGPGEIPVDGGTTTGLWRVDLRQFRGGQPLADLMAADGRLQFDAERRLAAIGFCPGFLCLSSGSTRVAEAGADQWVSWGRWTEGNAIMQVIGLPFQIPYSANTGMHYLVGSPALTVPTSGQFAYALTGATAPTMSAGQWAPGGFSGNASVRFEPGQAARLGLEAIAAFRENSFRLATEGGVANPGASQVAFDANHAFNAAVTVTQTGRDFCPGGGCTARISGGLFGPTGERLGVGYSIAGPTPSTTIDGVGVFTRQ